MILMRYCDLKAPLYLFGGSFTNIIVTMNSIAISAAVPKNGHLQ